MPKSSTDLYHCKIYTKLSSLLLRNLSHTWGIIRMCEQVAASGNILILYSAWLLFIWYINQGQGFPRSGACTLAADLYTGYPSPSRRRKTNLPFSMAVEPLCRNTLALSLPSCYLSHLFHIRYFGYYIPKFLLLCFICKPKTNGTLLFIHVLN